MKNLLEEQDVELLIGKTIPQPPPAKSIKDIEKRHQKLPKRGFFHLLLQEFYGLYPLSQTRNTLFFLKCIDGCFGFCYSKAKFFRAKV